MANCHLNKIFLGEIASVQNYGAFIRIPGCSQQGLIHKSQVSSSYIDDVTSVLQRGERVWCKVISMGNDGKIGLSMKHVNQGNGTDLDPNGVQLHRDEQKRKIVGPNQRKVIELQAVLNTTCTKCGTHGHLSKDCFMSPDGKKYELIPETEELDVPKSIIVEEESEKIIKKHKSKKSKDKKKSKKSKHNKSSNSDNTGSDSEKGRKKRKKKCSEERTRKRKKYSND